MNRAFEKELSRALAAEPDTAVPETLLRRCRAEHIAKQRSGWRDLLHCQFKLLGWKVWALEAMAALALYSVGRELAPSFIWAACAAATSSCASGRFPA